MGIYSFINLIKSIKKELGYILLFLVSMLFLKKLYLECVFSVLFLFFKGGNLYVII